MRARFVFAAVMAALAVWVSAPAALAQEAPKILEISGKARLLAAGKDLGPAQAGQTLAPGQAIELAGAGEVRLSARNGRIEIIAGRGAALRYDGQVAESSQPWKSSRQIQLAGVKAAVAGNTPQFSVGQGQVEAQVTPGQPLRLVAPLVTAAVRGTRFSLAVAPDGSSSMNTRQGRVEAMSRSGEVRQVTAGGSLGLTAGQFAGFLKAQGLTVPGGDWRRVSPAALEKVDGQTFAGRFADAGGPAAAAEADGEGGGEQSVASGSGQGGPGGASLDALLADPNGSPMAGQAAVTGAAGGAMVVAALASATGGLKSSLLDSSLQSSVQGANLLTHNAHVSGALNANELGNNSTHGWALGGAGS
ncbi:MAG: FecR family protein, partial [Candidatus Adiutrix sp.]|nr:FecR family protein [Candidatus Adiutrix sp.]